MSINVQNLDHVGVRVTDIERSINFYRDLLGLKVGSQSSLPSRGLKMALLVAGNGTIELLEYADQPVPANDGPVAHLAFRVADIENAWDKLAAAGVVLEDKSPREASGGMKIGFLRGPDNESIELVQR